MATRDNALSGGPAYVLETAEAWTVVDRASGDTLSSHEYWRSALNALLEFGAFSRAVRSGVFHSDTGSPDGVWRWLDASAEEPVVGHDGSQVTAGAMRSMVDRLNAAAQPVMIDGGSHDSGAHESTTETSVRANGWAHVGAEWVDLSGRVHLALYCELHPTIAGDVASGRLAFGSIAFSQSKEDRDDAALWSHALTNLPAVTGLMPSSANRHHPTGHVFARSLPTRNLMHETKKAVRNETAAPVAVADVVAPVAPVAEPAARADEPAPMSPEESVAFQSDVLKSLAKIFGDGTPAQLIEKLKASEDRVKAAVEASGPKADGTQADGVPNPPDVQAMSKAGDPSMRVIALETQIKRDSEALVAERTRAEKAEGEIEKRDLRERITARFAEAKLTLSAEQLDKFSGLLMRTASGDREEVLELQLRGINAPPVGRTVKAAPMTSVAPVVTPATVNEGVAGEAFAAAVRAVSAEHPEWPSAKRHAEAYARTRSTFVQAETAKN